MACRIVVHTSVLILLLCLTLASCKIHSIHKSEIHLLSSDPDPNNCSEDRPYVVLLHGASFSATTWENLGTIDYLVQKGFRVRAVNLPRYGDTTLRGKKEDFLKSVVEEFNFSPAVVVFPSMSGSYTFPFLESKLRSGSLKPDIKGVIGVAPVAVPAHLEALSQLDIPALFLYGSRDPMLRDRSKLMHLNPRIRTEVIEDAGHACYLDKPEKFHSILLNFLENLN